MKLKKIVDDITTVDERYRDLYEKRADGKYHLLVDADDAAELKGALENERKETTKLKAAAEKYKDIDPDKARDALAKLADIEETRRRREGEFDSLKAEMVKKHGEEKLELENGIKKRDVTIEKLVVDSAIISALSDAKGKVKVLLPHAKQRVRVIYENGEPKPVVVDEKGNPRIADGQATPMTIAQYVLEMKADPDFAPNFEADARGGGGAPGQRRDAGQGAGGVKTVSKKDPKAMSANLKDIASGKVAVTD